MCSRAAAAGDPRSQASTGAGAEEEAGAAASRRVGETEIGTAAHNATKQRKGQREYVSLLFSLLVIYTHVVTMTSFPFNSR